MNKPSLYLFTSKYPYGIEEPYIVNEIKSLHDLFEQINILPGTCDPVILKTPENVTVNFIKDKISENKFIKFFTLLRNIRLITIIMKGEFLSNGVKIFLKYFRDNISTLLLAIQHAEYFSENILIHSSGNIFYSFWMNEWALMLSILKYKRKIPGFIFRVHGFDLYDERRYDNYIPFRKFNMKMCDKVITVSKAGETYLKSKNIEPEKIFTSHLGTFDHGTNPFNPQEIFTVVSCSSTNFYKGVHEIPEVLRHLDFELRWIHFGGDGNFISLNDIRKKCEQLPKHIHWELRGPVPNEELMNFYKHNTVNLFLHLTFTEGGVAVVLQEAASFGIPLLSTNTGGVPEIVNEKTGILIEKEFEVDEVTKIISEFRNSKMNTEEFRRGVKKFWKENFNAETNYKKFYTELQ